MLNSHHFRSWTMLKKSIGTLLFALLLAGSCFAQLQGPVQPQSGSLTSAGTTCVASNCLVLMVPADASTATLQLTGTWTATQQFEVSADAKSVNDSAATWQNINAQPIPNGQQVRS